MVRLNALFKATFERWACASSVMIDHYPVVRTLYFQKIGLLFLWMVISGMDGDCLHGNDRLLDSGEISFVPIAHGTSAIFVGSVRMVGR